MKQLTMMALLVAVSVPVFAQTAASETQRDINQQQRIESGLQSGQLSTGEAGKLERQESRIDKVQSNALKNGNLSPAEKARINRMQNKASSEIAADKHNGVSGNPNSVSSQRMQADVQKKRKSGTAHRQRYQVRCAQQAAGWQAAGRRSPGRSY